MFLYPLAITLIILALFSPLFHHSKRVYQVTTGFTFIAAIFDGLNAIPMGEHPNVLMTNLLDFAKHTIPFFSIGMGWILPAAIGLVIGYIWQVIENKVTK